MSRTTRSQRPTLALCVIAKDEERFIADCLDSARPFVDELIVVDTGSTDRTRALAAERGARVVDFVWCDDFAAARNAAIETATADWILMLDADERLEAASAQRLREVITEAPSGAHALCPLIEHRTLDDDSVLSSTVAVPRIFRRRPDVRFKGAVHEVIVYVPSPDRTLTLAVPELRIVHYGYDPVLSAERAKDARNVALLERELERGVDDPRLLFFLLEQHSLAGRSTDAVAAFERFDQDAARLPRPFSVEAFRLYLGALCRLGDRAAVERGHTEAVRRGLLGAGAIEILSCYYGACGDRAAAAGCLEHLLRDLPDGLRERPRPARWQLHLKLAALWLEEDLRAAAQWLAAAIAECPATYDAQQQLLQMILQVYGRAPSVELANPFGAIDVALARRDLQAAYDLGLQLPTSMAGVVRSVATVEQLLAAGEDQAALQLLNRALDGPRVEAVYWLLIKTLTHLGRYQDAQLALEVLRARTAQAA